MRNLIWSLFSILILFGVLILCGLASVEKQGALYLKVQNWFPAGFSGCLLATLTVIPNVRKCLNDCSKTTNCSLACYKDSECRLYKAIVSKYWNRLMTTMPLQEEVGFECFTSWLFPLDITNQIVTVVAFEHPWPVLKPKFAYDGYYCETWGFEYYYHSDSTAPGYFVADMGKAFRVSTLIMKIRHVVESDTFFAYVEARVGNISGNGDYSKNPLFGFYNAAAEQGEIVTLQANRMMYGRYISLKTLADHNYLTIGELTILG